MNLKPIAAIGLLAVGIGAVGVSVFGIGLPASTSTVTYRTAMAATTTVQQTAAASGTLVAATRYELAFGSAPVAIDGTASSSSSSAASAASASSVSNASSGAGGASLTVTWPVTAVKVAVGDLVKQGDTLATADTTTAELAVRLAEANLAAAKEQKATDLAGGTDTARQAAKDQLTSAQQSLANARASYAGTVAQNNISLSRAQDQLDAANAKYTADKAAGAPADTLTADKASISSAEDNLTSVKLQIAGSNRQASSQVTSAKSQVTSAQRNYTQATSSADDATLANDDVAILNAETALADAKTALENATLVAPMDGRITVVNAVVGEESTGTAVELQSLQLATTVSVGESDILSLAVGQDATVDVTATGSSLSGRVTAVDPVAASSGSSSVVSYTVTVLLDEAAATAASATPAAASATPAATPLAGMSAEVTVVIAKAENVLAVPAIALSGTSGSYTVRVLNSDGTVESRSVQVGLIASDYAEITSGVTAGEAIVTGSSADKTTTSSSSSSGTGSGRDGGGFGGLSGGGGFPQPPNGGGQMPGQ